VREPVLDGSMLRAVAFNLASGLSGLLAAMAALAARVPPEIYNGDEDAPLPAGDVGLSILARDIQAVRRQVSGRHWARSQRERAALRNAERLRDYLVDGSLIVDPLRPTELPRREHLQDRYGIGRGEAASLVLAERYGVEVVYLSPDGLAYEAARCEGVRSIAIRDAVAA
jgi:hypothetical protein